MANFETVIIDIIASCLKITTKRVKPDSKLKDDLGLSSYHFKDLSHQLTKHIGKELTTKQLENFKIIQDIVDFAEGALKPEVRPLRMVL